VIAFIGYLAAFLTTASAIPQLVTTLRTHDVRGVSLTYWCTLAIGVAFWLLYGVLIGSGPLIAANAVTLALDVAVLTLTIRFRMAPKPLPELF
jgi:MtN3 and saliva related transmembrane protein